MLIKIQGFAPDLDPTTEGVLTECVNMLPTLSGMEAALGEQDAQGLPALAAECTGTAVCTKLDGTNRFFAGTTTQLYEAATSSWTNVSRASTYAGSVDVRWRFCQFGDISIAVNGADNIQASSSSAFVDAATSVKAEVCDVVGDFVFLGNYNDGTDVPHGVWWSALGDFTDWTPDIATQCGKDQLTSTPNGITALRRLGDSVVVYKKRAMYLGTYQGPPILWAFSELSNTTGALCQEVVIPIVTPEIGFAHVWMGEDDFYMFAGGQIKRIGTPIREYVFENITRQYDYKSAAMHDFDRGLIFFYYPTGGSNQPNKCVVFNYRSGKWGSDDRSIELPVNYITGGYTYTKAENAYSTYASVPSIAYGSPFWQSSNQNPAVFNTSHTVKLLVGAPGTCSFTTGDLGDDSVLSTISRVNPRWLYKPSTANLTHYYRMENGDNLTTGDNVNMSSGRFDILQDAKWHRFKIETDGFAEVSALKYEIERSSDE